LGPKHGGAAFIEFTARLTHDTPCALRFYLDLENDADAVPEPASGLLAAPGLAVGLRRRGA
jgi:hypothetical protein